ncbi:MAG: hypothetical protein ACI8RZ_006100 [Myxococcota bacterium]|jgi:hypothetical protein
MLSALLLANSAMAWNHTQWLWDRDDLPLPWYMNPTVEDSITEEYMFEVMQKSWDNWTTYAPCAQLSNEYMGVLENNYEPSGGDQLNVTYFDDPSEINGGGALAVTYTITSGELAFSRNGLNYYYAYDSDMVFSQNVAWGTTEDIENGICNAEYAVEGTATHEIGHLWGMAHSCEEEDVAAGDCDDQELYDAVMFWTGGACEVGDADLNDDDIEGINALYGPYATFEATTETRGGVPLEVCFDLSSNSAVIETEWNYGDGQIDTLTELETCHTYTEQGQYTINVAIRGEDDECGEWEYTERERALVVVCEPPQPAEGFDGMFTYDRSADDDDADDGTLVYQMINQADLSVYGCIEQAQWDVFKGDELIQSIKAWSPKLAFPGEGTYEVILNLGGPGGINAESLTIEATEAGGCSTVGAGAGLVSVFIGVLGAGVRRRRD